jgi:signal transduction histidine kinase
MFRSLRFRLPAIFLFGVALAGLVASLIAIRLFQDHVRKESLGELRREAIGIAQLYGEKAGDIEIAPESLERATGDRLFYIGLDVFPGQLGRLTQLPVAAVPEEALVAEGPYTFEFRPPGEERPFLAVSHPLVLEAEGIKKEFGTLVVAKPKTELRSRWVTLFERLALAFLAGIAVAGMLAWYLSRRITRPVLALSEAADQIAEGRYDVEVPKLPRGDEIGQLSERFSQMADRLRETEELERNFLMSVSHELRTPLTAIRGHVDALREGVVEDPELRAMSLDVVAAEADRLERLVGDILDLAKLDAHRFTLLREEVDMKRLLDRAYTAFTEEARRRAIEYHEDVRAEPVITSDGDRVLQIITNLLANAFRWTPDGGRIGIALAAANGDVSVSVSDSGPGIAAHERDRIFRPFWSRDGGGTGLGLAIARELATALGGRLDLESSPGRGSRFELVLPGDVNRDGDRQPTSAGGRLSSIR